MKLKRIVCLFAALLTLSASSAAALADSGAPVVIGPMSYEGAVVVGEEARLSVVFSSRSAGSRTYWTEVYAVRDGTAWLKAARNVTVPGGRSVEANYSLEFSSPGEFRTLVKVYAAEGGALLASRQGRYADRSAAGAPVIIGPMSWDGRLRAGGTLELSVSFSGAPGAYRAYIYAVRDGSAWLKASGRVEIPESGSARAVFRAGFGAPGEFCTLVKVYAAEGGAFLASRQGLYPDRIFAP